MPGNADPAQLPNGSETDQFVDQDRRTGTDSILTVPLIGWVPKARDYSCGFSIATYGPQQNNDAQWRPDCGNGVKPDGTEELTSTIGVSGGLPGQTSAQAWRHGEADPNAITRTELPVLVAPGCPGCSPYYAVPGAFPANSITTIAIGG